MDIITICHDQSYGTPKVYPVATANWKFCVNVHGINLYMSRAMLVTFRDEIDKALEGRKD